MNSSHRPPIVAAFFALALFTGCGGSRAPDATKGSNPGQTGVTFLVNVFPQSGGTIVSMDDQIHCSTATPTRCGPAIYPWSAQVLLTATADAGTMFGGWAGDCTGLGPCILDTSVYGADKFVTASFGAVGLTQHTNFTNPSLHGDQFRLFIRSQADDTITTYFRCTACHGGRYQGIGIAPACGTCHDGTPKVIASGTGNWLTTCNFCHGAPPDNGLHPAVSSNIAGNCFGCHQGTVDAAGVIIPGGDHMNGQINATGGHAAGYNNPSIHGRDFFEAVSSNPANPYCTGCHGATFNVPIANGQSCNACHAAAGWNVTAWNQNCTFCHGAKTPGYTAAALAAAAPPDALSQRLTGTAAPDRTGAHGIHLAGSAFAGPVQCSNCHTVPGTASTFGHISGRDVPATVVVQGPGAAGPEAGYQADATCLTRCHGANPSPPWTFTGIQCNECHGVPPGTAIHAGFSSASTTVCRGCHPDTITVAGTIDVASGAHVNGTVNVIDGHAAGFALRTNHGPAALDFFSAAPGALQCTTCHGEALDYCTNCHSTVMVQGFDAGGNLTDLGTWQNWRTNCTFCHGTRTPVYTPSADPTKVASPALVAPPDAVSQRLTGIGAPDRSGRHARHLSNGGFAPSPFYECAGCHRSTGAGAHVITSDRRAPVTITAAAFPGLSAADIARLPNPLGTYDPASGSCTVYCHGSTMQGSAKRAVVWTSDFALGTRLRSCTDCHGSPPLSGVNVVGLTYTGVAPNDTRYCGVAGCTNHDYHSIAQTENGFDSCANCHYGSAQGTFYNGLHANGRKDVVFTPPNTPGYKSFTASWNSTTRTCTTSCHTKSGTTTAQPW